MDNEVARDGLHLRLLGLGDRLQAYAHRHRMSVAGTVRQAIVHLLETEPDRPMPVASEVAESGPKTRLLLSLTATRAQQLSDRAQGCGMSRSDYVCALLDGTPPPALPRDHAEMIATLCKSNDQLAVLSSDVQAWLRELRARQDPAQPLPLDGADRLLEDTYQHLFSASTLLAELRSTRRI